jgi:hypothetical protein
MSRPHYVRPDHHELPFGNRQDGQHEPRLPKPRQSTAPAGLFAPAPEVVAEKAVRPKRRQSPDYVRPSRATGVRKVAECGTDAGYHRHLKVTKTSPCEACREAHKVKGRERSGAKPLPVLAPCGTEKAYRRHLRRRETPDEQCVAAHRVAQREADARRRAEKPPRVRRQQYRENCGTKAGYQDHHARRERACDACKTANEENAA